VVLAGFCAFLDLYAPQPLLPMLARLFKVSTGRVSLVVTVSTVAVALAAPFVGILADRFGRKRIIVPATVLLALPTLLAAFSTSLNQLLFWRFWQGVLTPGIFAATVAYIAEEWEGPTGKAVTAYVVGTVVGGFCGRTLAALMAHYVSWQAAFVLLGVLNLAGGVAIWAWLPADRKRHTPRAKHTHLAQMLGHFRNPRLLATYATGFCVLFTLLATFTYVNFYLAAPPFRLSTAALGLLFVVYLGGAAIAAGAGRWIDRLGHRKMVIYAFCGGIGGVLLTLIHNVPSVMIGLTLICSGTFIAQSSASSYIGKAAEHGRASAVGLYVMFYYAGGSFGAAIPGRLWNWAAWPACAGLIIVVQLLTITLAGVFWKPVGVHPTQPSEHEAEAVPVWAD
jgi:predicted MFS family arabinose efflux permease